MKTFYTIWYYTPHFLKDIIVRIICRIKFSHIQIQRGCIIPITELLAWRICIWMHTLISKNCSIFSNKSSKVTIWKYCSIAQDVYIISYNHNLDIPSQHVNQFNNPINIKDHWNWSPVTIWNDVWIGTKAVILPWVTIWNGAVVWAGSIVTKDVESYSVVAWNPAKKIRQRFETPKIQFLDKSEWWNWNEKKIKTNKDFFNLNISSKSLEEIKKSISE